MPVNLAVPLKKVLVVPLQLFFQDVGTQFSPFVTVLTEIHNLCNFKENLETYLLGITLTSTLET